MIFIKNTDVGASYVGAGRDEVEVYDKGDIKVRGPLTLYGVVLEGYAEIDGEVVKAGRFFVLPVETLSFIIFHGRTAMFRCQGFLGRWLTGSIPLSRGDVNYIDGCTDSLLVCPPRLGDPCLNALYFPPGIDQSFHTHPSYRMGCVLRGHGLASTEQGDLPLEPGDVFCIMAGERHRFRTPAGGYMTVVAFHPDSDWGPTDEAHPMINRTILEK